MNKITLLFTVEKTTSFDDATKVFDELTGASYYGQQFKQTLVSDPEAMIAAQHLVARLRARGQDGMGPPSSKRKT